MISTQVCNYLYYCSLANGVPYVFVHVPPVKRVPLEAQVETLSRVRGYLVEAVGNNAVDVLADVAAVANGAGIVDQLVARASHAALGGARRADASVIERWAGAGETVVVVVAAPHEGLSALRDAAPRAGLPHCLVADAGRTEVAPGTETVLAVGPGEVSRADATTTGRLRLLR